MPGNKASASRAQLGFLLELNLVLTSISVAFLPYHTPVIFTPATLATLDLWTIYFPQNNEVLLY